jgi:hypothetical protein
LWPQCDPGCCLRRYFLVWRKIFGFNHMRPKVRFLLPSKGVSTCRHSFLEKLSHKLLKLLTVKELNCRRSITDETYNPVNDIGPIP